VSGIFGEGKARTLRGSIGHIRDAWSGCFLDWCVNHIGYTRSTGEICGSRLCEGQRFTPPRGMTAVSVSACFARCIKCEEPQYAGEQNGDLPFGRSKKRNLFPIFPVRFSA